jgi:hypothetical protein
LTLTLVSPLLARSVAADEATVVTGGFATTEAGVFSVGVAAMPDSGDCADVVAGDGALGSFSVDAVGEGGGVVSRPLTLCLTYVDGEASRGSFTVQMSIDNFELRSDQIPTFENSEIAHFQIPNRYLALTAVGDIKPTGAPPVGDGTLDAVKIDQNRPFSLGAVTIARAGGSSGTGASFQRIDLTLNIPAGVYPGEYDSVVTIETVAGD